jgi:trimeric autotransporter adhesin
LTRQPKSPSLATSRGKRLIAQVLVVVVLIAGLVILVVASGRTGSVTVVDGTGPLGEQFSTISLAPGAAVLREVIASPARDVDVSSSFRIASVPGEGTAYYAAWQLRTQHDGSAYRGRVEFLSGGKLRLSVSRVTGGTETNLGRFDLPFTVRRGDTINVEYTANGASGVNLSGRAWLDGKPRPDWQLTVVDDSAEQISVDGPVTFWSYAPNKNTKTMSFEVGNVVGTGQPTVQSDRTPVPDPGARRGALAVGTASFPVPVGAIFVDGVNGTKAGDGTEASPFRTVAAAVKGAWSGQTIVIRAGTYHESVTVPPNKSLTVQNYPGEAVWFDGTRAVTAWKKVGKVWVASGWTARFDRDMGGGQNSRFVDPAHPNADRPDQVFFDGSALEQVSDRSSVRPGTFAVDYDAKQLIIGDNPAGRDVRASDKSQALAVQSPGSTLQGFGVRGYATTYAQRAAVRMQNVSAKVKDLVIVDNAMIGLALSNNDGFIDNVTAERNGLLGIGVNASYRLVVRDSIATGNNTEGFKAAPVAGGIKITRSRDVTVLNNEVSRNLGSGIWLDESCYDVTIAGNTTTANTQTGIVVEISEKAVVADNQAIGNDTGIHIIDSGQIRVYNNDIGSNLDFGIKLSQDQRRQADFSVPGHDRRRTTKLGGPDPTMPWLVKDVVIANNAFGSGEPFAIYARDGKTNRSADDMDLTITGNLFSAFGKGQLMVAWGESDNRTYSEYKSPRALAAAKGTTWTNAITATRLTITELAEAKVAKVSIAVPIPTDVAANSGLVAGSRSIGAP